MQDWFSIGQNIRKYRIQRKLSHEALAERINVSPNYIGSLERGDRMPSIEVLVNIINALDVSADEILHGVINNGYTVKISLLTEKISKLSDKDKARIFDVIDTLIKHSVQVKP